MAACQTEIGTHANFGLGESHCQDVAVRALPRQMCLKIYATKTKTKKKDNFIAEKKPGIRFQVRRKGLWVMGFGE